MEHFDEVEVTIKFYIVLNKGKHKNFMKHIENWMKSTLQYYNYENLKISATNIKE